MSFNKEVCITDKEKTIIEDGNVIVVTNSTYSPINDFESIFNIDNLKHTKPTVIQKYVMPIIQKKMPVHVRAPTGSGKTLAFLLPLIENIKYSGIGIVICIITPTRELAIQIKNEAKKLFRRNKLRVEAMYGGRPNDDIKKYTDILVATPGRLLDNLKEKILSLDRVEYLVLDEADRLLDIGFSKSIEEIKSFLNPLVKVGLFSATYQKGLDTMIKCLLPEGHLYVKIKNETVSNIKQKFLLEEDNKDKIVREILGKLNLQQKWTREIKDKAIIFVEKCTDTDILKQKLIENDLRCESLHGNKDQKKREIILEAFRSGTCPILIATSVAARGIDINGISLVINYNFPQNIKDYIHRIGRTGRVGKIGEAISFIDLKSLTSEIRKNLVSLLEESGNEVPPFLLKQYSRDNNSSGNLKSNFNKGIVNLSISKEKVLKTSENSKITEKIDSEDETVGLWGV